MEILTGGQRAVISLIDLCAGRVFSRGGGGRALGAYRGQVKRRELRRWGAITAPSDEGIEPGDERLDIHREGADFL